MGVICFASLKGGVGKTSLSINVAHAFSVRGCESIIIDLDPNAHATRVFNSSVAPQAKRAAGKKKTRVQQEKTSGLPGVGDLPVREREFAKLLLLGEEGVAADNDEDESFDELLQRLNSAVVPVRKGLSLLPGSSDLRHCLWGRGAQKFRTVFPALLDELRATFDFVVIDTPPDFNVLSRTALASSDIVVVPVDSSAMSIHSLEELISSGSHIKGPRWTILRSMVNRQASRIRKMSESRLAEHLSLGRAGDLGEGGEDFFNGDISDPDAFIDFLESCEPENQDEAEQSEGQVDDSPIFLLNSLVYRTEQQNRLTFKGKTAFDQKATAALAEQYLRAAKELEDLLSFGEDSEESELAEFSALDAAGAHEAPDLRVIPDTTAVVR